MDIKYFAGKIISGERVTEAEREEASKIIREKMVEASAKFKARLRK